MMQSRSFSNPNPNKTKSQSHKNLNGTMVFHQNRNKNQNQNQDDFDSDCSAYTETRHINHLKDDYVPKTPLTPANIMFSPSTFGVVTPNTTYKAYNGTPTLTYSNADYDLHQLPMGCPSYSKVPSITLQSSSNKSNKPNISQMTPSNTYTSTTNNDNDLPKMPSLPLLPSLKKSIPMHQNSSDKSKMRVSGQVKGSRYHEREHEVRINP